LDGSDSPFAKNPWATTSLGGGKRRSRCPRCGARNPLLVTHCASCGALLAEGSAASKNPGRQASDLAWWNHPRTKWAYWEGGVHERLPVVVAFLVFLGCLLRVTSLGEAGIWESIAAGLVLGTFSFMVCTAIVGWVRGRSGIVGGIWRGLSVAAGVLGVIVLFFAFMAGAVDDPASGVLLYLAFMVLALALIFFGISWVVVQNARKAKRDEDLRLAVREMAQTQPTPHPGFKQTSGTPPSVADELNKLAALVDRGLLTGEEFNKAKRELLNTPGSERDDGVTA